MAQLVTILAIAGIYSLLALGVVLIYRTSRVLSLVQGEAAVMLGYGVALVLGPLLPPWLAVPAALLAAASLGWLIFRLFMRRIMAEPPYVGVIMTVGVAILLHGLLIVFFGGRSVGIDWGFAGPTTLFGETVVRADLVVIVIAWLAVGALVVLYRFTHLGLQMRAIAERVTLAAQRGIDVNRVVGLSWILAVTAAAMAGILHGERSLLSPTATLIGINALIATIIGGMDSIKGAIIGALVVAVSEDLAARLIEPRYGLLAPALVLLLVLVFRPWGLFGTAEDLKRV